ncbi:MAG: marine proteobacterial sortase target protein [Xanthomonadales bacterium]|nr:marine proteobacterial sortase target protein [Xanthomonadales bacterium]
MDRRSAPTPSPRETRKPRMFARHWRRRLAAFGAVLCLIASARADCAGLEYRSGDGAWMPGLALDTTVTMQVEGLLAEVRIVQRYENASQDWREGRYLLPLPGDAAVGGLSIRIGDRLIEGEIQEKQQARATFAQAAATGRRAALVEQQRGNVFKTALTNIGPGEAIEVEIAYWQQVDYREGVFSLALPLTFTPPPNTQATRDPLRQTVSLDPAATLAVDAAPLPPSVAIFAEIHPGMALAELSSATHAIDVEQRDGAYFVHLRDFVVEADHDFELRWKPQPSAAPMQAVFAEHGEDAAYAMVMLVPPTQAGNPLPRELILVLDHSGSMLGTSMEQAKAAVDAALATLRPEDRFNVVSFNHTATRWFAESPAPTDAALDETRTRLSQLRADGGTELSPALQQALQGTVEPGLLRQVVLVTDAAVGDELGLLAQIEKQRGDARVFAVGIGSAPNEYFVRRAAEQGRGSFELIRDLNQVSERMGALMTRIDRPMLSDIDLRWPGAAEFYPSRIPDLYAGEPLLVVARLDALQGQVQARGVLAKQGWQSGVALKVGARQQPVGIGRLWAKARIRELESSEREGGDPALIREEIIRTSMAHGITSRFTSLVAVERTPARPEGESLLADQVPNAEPAQTLNLAQGATSARLHLGSALAVLLLGFALFRRAPSFD